ncbi:cytidine deaminase [Paenibacillus sp. GCM10023252]|uniref:cytidine deaminase n=1 Tax=Paenibacillus sp. GCM10023252 TaxID=3252649 RepID=UPI00360CB5FB
MFEYEGLSPAYAELLHAAGEARKRAYVPYSQFQVGAALLDEHGNVHQGCNVENAAYSPTNCAERTALHRAIADGVQPGAFQAIAVIGDTDGPITPCGVCRQVIIELCRPDMPVIMGNLTGKWTVTTAAALLPGAFTPAQLRGEQDHTNESTNQ